MPLELIRHFSAIPSSAEAEERLRTDPNEESELCYGETLQIVE